jgi:Phage tail protein
MTTTPPSPAAPGQQYLLMFSFTDYESGALTDPSSLQLDITYGSEVALVADVAGPFYYTGASGGAPQVLWRISTGQYAFLWNVPAGALPGVYVANWTSIYGPDGDSFLTTENFPVTGGAPFTSPPSGDVGFWSGSLSYAPSWASAPFVINFGATDDNGITWIWQKIDGWDSAPAVGQVIQRAADHGGWPAPQYYGPRIITLTVMASAPTQALRDMARAQLQQCVPIGDLATLTYNEPVPKVAFVRRNASASVTETHPTLCDVVFTIPLVAPDPRKYATTPQTVGLLVPPPIVNPLALPLTFPISFPGNIPPSDTVVTALNVGTFETRPAISVAGPIVSPQIVNATTAQVVSFTGLTMAATDQLVLDMDNRQAFLDGSFYAADVSSAWWVLEPGSTQVYLDGVTTGGATLTMTYSSAWM